jgi:hypothetical protein
MSSFEYFTTRAAASVAACAGEHGKATALKTAIATVQRKPNCHCLRRRCFIDLLLLRELFASGNLSCDWQKNEETNSARRGKRS